MVNAIYEEIGFITGLAGKNQDFARFWNNGYNRTIFFAQGIFSNLL